MQWLSPGDLQHWAKPPLLIAESFLKVQLKLDRIFSTRPRPPLSLFNTVEDSEENMVADPLRA